MGLLVILLIYVLHKQVKELCFKTLRYFLQTCFFVLQSPYRYRSWWRT